jgi:hypothetical protein
MLRSFIVIIVSLVFTGCSSISVSTDYDPAIDFNAYKTFAVHKDAVKGSKLEIAPLIKSRVIDAVERTMVQKGFAKAEIDKADIIVFPFAGTKDKMNVTDWGYSYGGYWGGYPYGRNIDVSYYTEASLVLDFVANEKDELVWRGIGTGALDPDKTPEERTQSIDYAVAEILSEYPPQTVGTK